MFSFQVTINSTMISCFVKIENKTVWLQCCCSRNFYCPLRSTLSCQPAADESMPSVNFFFCDCFFFFSLFLMNFIVSLSGVIMLEKMANLPFFFFLFLLIPSHGTSDNVHLIVLWDNYSTCTK